MIKFTMADGSDVWINPYNLSIIGKDLQGRALVFMVGSTQTFCLQTSPEEIVEAIKKGEEL